MTYVFSDDVTADWLYLPAPSPGFYLHLGVGSDVPLPALYQLIHAQVVQFSDRIAELMCANTGRVVT